MIRFDSRGTMDKMSIAAETALCADRVNVYAVLDRARSNGFPHNSFIASTFVDTARLRLPGYRSCLRVERRTRDRFGIADSLSTNGVFR
jgi:hypothetical protein